VGEHSYSGNDARHDKRDEQLPQLKLGSEEQDGNNRTNYRTDEQAGENALDPIRWAIRWQGSNA